MVRASEQRGRGGHGGGSGCKRNTCVASTANFVPIVASAFTVFFLKRRWARTNRGGWALTAACAVVVILVVVLAVFVLILTTV